jgi:acyl carrier protein
MATITKEDFNNVVGRKVRERMEVPDKYDFIEQNGSLFNDYCLDSLDVMEIILEFESIYRIKIDDRKIQGLKTAQDLWAIIPKD